MMPSFTVARSDSHLLKSWRLGRLLELLNNSFKGRRVLQPFFERVHSQCLSGMNYGRGGSLQTSGEIELLRRIGKEQRLRQCREFTLFDIGANRGDYSLAALQTIGSGLRTFCFEPVRSTFQLLQNQVVGIPQITCLQIAMSDHDGWLKIFSDSPGSLVSSAIPSTLSDFGIGSTGEETVSARTVVSVCNELKIDKIDLMKIDVEGMELKVLKGALDLLSQRRIQRIQFEFGHCQIHAGVFFRDFFELLSPNYRIFRIVRDGLVEMKDYETRHEVFWTINYLAELR